MSTRICIGQMVRPDGTVLTEALTAEDCGPSFGYWPQQGFEIMDAAYGRWRFTDENTWRVTNYWPNGPHDLPAFTDNTGEGQFQSMNPGDPAMARDEVAQALRIVK